MTSTTLFDMVQGYVQTALPTWSVIAGQDWTPRDQTVLMTYGDTQYGTGLMDGLSASETLTLLVSDRVGIDALATFRDAVDRRDAVYRAVFDNAQALAAAGAHLTTGSFQTFPRATYPRTEAAPTSDNTQGQYWVTEISFPFERRL